MESIRLEDVLDSEADSVDTDFTHIEHMYTGRLSSYYYRRFDHALERADISRSDSVLVVGVGTGVFALTLSELVADVHVTDIAREEPLFSTVKQLFDATPLSDDNVAYAAADATRLPYSSGSFDVVFALDVLEHVPDERSAIEEISRVLRPDGRAVVSVPIEVGPVVLIRELYRRIDGGRQLTQSVGELVSAAIGTPIVDSNGHHRGYDFRTTRNRLDEVFGTTAVEYCPLKPLKWMNPTAIVTAESRDGRVSSSPYEPLPTQ